MSAAVLRPARAADAPAIHALLQEVYAPFAGRFAPTALGEDEQSIAPAAGSWLLAHGGEELVGCVCHYPEDGAHTFCFLAVRPAWRRRGIATQLLNGVLAAAAAAGAPRVLIAVRLSLHENVRFFSARGFAATGEQLSPQHGVFALEVAR